MDIATSTILMTEELQRVRSSALARVFGWELDVHGLAVHIPLRPRVTKDRHFLLRASFDDFPLRAPSCIFVDLSTREGSDAAWPPGLRHSANPPRICTPGTRECHEHYHLNDGQYPWSAERYPFLQTLAEIHRLMERGLGGRS